jgi:hypothetical protein
MGLEVAGTRGASGTAARERRRRWPVATRCHAAWEQGRVPAGGGREPLVCGLA